VPIACPDYDGTWRTGPRSDYGPRRTRGPRTPPRAAGVERTWTDGSRTFAPPFLAHDVVFAPDGRTVWLTSGEEGRIALYRGERRPSRRLDAGAAPQHITFAREKAFVASGEDGTVRRHRLEGPVVREARVPSGSYNIAFAYRWLVTPSLGHGTLALLDRNGRLRATRTVASAAHDACIVIGY
jgi:hypothetical protein